MTILRIGSTEKYADNWGEAFGEAPAASGKGGKLSPSKAAPAKKTATKTKPAQSPKKSPKKSSPKAKK